MRFLSAGNVAIKFHRTLPAHLSKIIEDAWIVESDRYDSDSDDEDDIGKKKKVTARDLQDELCTGKFVYSHVAFATILCVPPACCFCCSSCCTAVTTVSLRQKDPPRFRRHFLFLFV